MTLFDKLSGLAQRAKDNAAAKMAIVKDKRLEQSLSGTISANDMILSQMATYGLPGSVCMAAFDPMIGLLAVVGRDFLRLFGKGVSGVLPLPDGFSDCKYIQFHRGRSTLIFIDTHNVVYCMDLATKRSRSLRTERIITSCELCADTDWMFVGCIDGSVVVVDLEQLSLVDYAVPNLLKQSRHSQGTNETLESLFVVALQMHPMDLNTLLIGYESAVFLWNVRDQSIRRVFSLQRSGIDECHNNAQLTCMAWSPEGDRFVAGYDDGFLHFWDEREDKRPHMSRRVLDIPAAKDGDKASQPCDPVYSLAWHADERRRKSFLAIHGGTNVTEAGGLHILEFGLGSDEKLPSKQAALPSPVLVKDYLFLVHEPDEQGLQSLAGLLIVGFDETVRAHDLHHGYQPLALPSAISFLEPTATHACHIAMLPDHTFRRLCAPVNGQADIKHLPLTGGDTGPGHIYKLDSRDLLLTIHASEQIKFWDAAYTSLRPLNHLDILCGHDEPNTAISCIDLNPHSGSLSVGFQNGVILVYRFVHKVATPQGYVEQCDATLKEISELLESMSDEPEEGQEEHSEPAPPPIISIEKLDTKKDTTGYIPAIRIMATYGSVDHIVSGGTLLAFSTTQGKVYVVDILTSNEILCCNVQAWLTEGPTSEESTQANVTITRLKLANTYYASKVSKSSTQLFIGLSNGHVYQHNLPANSRGQAPLFRSSAHSPIVDIHVIDIAGKDQTTVEAEILKESTLFPQASTSSKDNESTSSPSTTSPEEKVSNTKNAPRRSFSLRRNPSKKQSQSEYSPPTGSGTDTTGSGDGCGPKRPSVSSRLWPEYQYQENPHWVVILTTTSINVLLAGFNIKFSSVHLDTMDGWHSDNRLVRGQILCFEGVGTCLSALLQTGELLLFSLPDLKPLSRLLLRDHGVHPDQGKMNEATLTRDGRLVVWTGKYELRQCVYMAQNDIPFGESVTFYTRHRKPASVATEKNKKSWLTTVAGAFQKNAMTVDELNTLMGRVELGDTRQQQKQATRTAANQGSSIQGNIYQELGNKVNERGEKLNDIGQKVGEMNDASHDFLKAIKAYNERQAQKKWWEF